MVIKFNKYLDSVAELKMLDRTNPFIVAAAAVNIMSSYDSTNPDKFYELLQFLMGEVQPMTPMFKQQIRDRMMDGKHEYIGKSYFYGATPENNYTPVNPLQVVVNENPYSYENEGYARLMLKSGGADNERPLTMRKLKDGNWLIWSDSIMGLMAGIRIPESANPWA